MAPGGVGGVGHDAAQAAHLDRRGAACTLTNGGEKIGKVVVKHGLDTHAEVGGGSWRGGDDVERKISVSQCANRQSLWKSGKGLKNGLDSSVKCLSNC